MEKPLLVKAKLGSLRVSSRKTRLAADLIRGLDTTEARKQLSFADKKVARSILKLLDSALANARNNFQADVNNLFVAEIRVDAGPTLKRWMPRAMGRATAIRKRTCQIELILKERIASVTSGKKKPSHPEVVQDKLKEDERPALKVSAKGKKEVKLPQEEKRPFGASGDAKKRIASRQTAAAAGKKIFRRKSI